jgi:hypothetical protein
MADDDDPYANTDPYAKPAVVDPMTAMVRAAADAQRVDPVISQQQLQGHRQAFQEREKERAGIEGKQQLNVDDMTKLLDETAATIKKSRAGRSNLPLMAMGAAMMSSPGNFGTQLGAGFGAMVPAIQKQRQEDDETALQLAKLGLKKGEIAAGPMDLKLKYIQALQLGDMNAIRSIETQLARAGATSGDKAADQARKDLEQSRKEQQLKLKVITDASAAAQKRFAEANKDTLYSQEEAQKIYEHMLKDEIDRRAGGAGITINQDEVGKTMGRDLPALGTPDMYFPKKEDMAKAGEKVGLPEPPPTYDDMGAKERHAERARQQAGYSKAQAGWETDSAKAADLDDQLQQARDIIARRPDLVGPAQKYLTDVSSDAQQLNRILKNLQVHGVPKGQGQVSNMERELFADAGVTMKMQPKAAIEALDQQREALKRGVDHREFMDTYFKTYKTFDGANAAWEKYVHSAGSTVIRNQRGELVANPNRMSWQDFYKAQRANPNAPVSAPGQTGQTGTTEIKIGGPAVHPKTGMPLKPGMTALDNATGDRLVVDPNGKWVRKE